MNENVKVVFGLIGGLEMPAGEQIKGRMMNVIGQPIDGMNELDTD